MAGTPGVLDFALELKPVARISPSHYEILKKCALREVWAAGRQPTLLPTGASAQLGSVIHRLLEDAGSGQVPPGDREAVAEHWAAALAQVESAMQQSWQERHLVPLHKSVPEYEVRQRRAWALALSIAAAAGRGGVGPPAPGRKPDTELWVQSTDGLVGGKIDYIAMAPGGPIIRDYKSGSVFERGSDGLTIKAEYQTQLRLYAALYQQQTGIMPSRLELVPLEGDPVVIAFNAVETAHLLDAAVAALHMVNGVLASYPASEAPLRLAAPSPEICPSCPFRPACLAYQEARQVESSNPGWPRDLLGSVADIRQLGNGTFTIGISSGDGGGEPQRVTGLDPAPTRHPALAYLKPGSRVGVYNLLKPRESATSFTEGQLTTIYAFAPAGTAGDGAAG